jgi:hypothetical protein
MKGDIPLIDKTGGFVKVLGIHRFMSLALFSCLNKLKVI